MKFNPNKSKGSPKKKREILPVGTYLMNVDFVERALSRQKGTPYLGFTYVVAAGPSKGKRLYDNAYLLDSTIWKIEAIVKALGIREEFDTDDQSDLLEKFCGKQMIVSVVHETSEYVNADGQDTESTDAKADNYRATSETKERLAKLKEQNGEPVDDDDDNDGHPSALPPGTAGDVPNGDMPF